MSRGRGPTTWPADSPAAALAEMGRLNLGDEVRSKDRLDNRTSTSLASIKKDTPSANSRNELTAIAKLLPEVEHKDSVMDLSKYLDRGEMIAQGAFGEVYKGKWINLPTSCDDIEMPQVAIKVMRACPLSDQKQRRKRMKNSRRELYLLQNLAHDHILPLLGTANLNGDENFPVIVSPWMENGSNPSIVHGDMKAANVLVKSDITLWETTATHAGFTTRWAPPELLDPEGDCKATTASDVYSYAMTCFEILSGQIPYASLRNEVAVAMAVATKDKRPDRELVPDASNELWHLMTRCWAKDANDRPPTQDVADEIRWLLELNTEGQHDQNGPGISLRMESVSQPLYRQPRRAPDGAASLDDGAAIGPPYISEQTPATTHHDDVTGKRAPIAKALIITIAYKSQRYWEGIAEGRVGEWSWEMELGGYHEVALQMRYLLLDKYGYEDRNIVILREGSNIYRPPTKENIEKEMRRLVADAADGDRFTFFYSGHGDQKDAVDDTKESDGKDEYIIPWDHDNLTKIILDDDIRKMLIEPIKHKKVNFIGIFDCCHSGTIMDLEEYKYNETDLPGFRLQEPSLPAPSATGSEAARGIRNQRRKGPARHILVRPGSLSAAVFSYLGVTLKVDCSSELGENYIVSEDKHSGEKAPPQVLQYEDRFAPSRRPTTLPFTSPSNSLLMEKDNHAIAHDVLSDRLLVHDKGKADAVVTQSYPAAQLSESPEPSSPASPIKASFAEGHVLANVTSWSACADEELNWENSRGEAMGKPMVEYLLDHSTPTYRELLLQLTGIMEQNFQERKAAYEQAGSTELVVPQRPQLGSLRQLDLDTKMII